MSPFPDGLQSHPLHWRDRARGEKPIAEHQRQSHGLPAPARIIILSVIGLGALLERVGTLARHGLIRGATAAGGRPSGMV
jgi:hypothetical protein